MATDLSKVRKKISQSTYTIIVIFNVLSLILGVKYYFVGNTNTIWNMYGFLMLITLLGNIGLVVRIGNSKELRNNKRIGYLYLFLSALFSLIIPFINTVASSIPTYQKSRSMISTIMLFSLFILGGVLAARNQLQETNLGGKDYLSDKEVLEPKTISRRVTYFKNFSIILLSAVLYSGLFIAINLLRKYKNGFLEVIASQYSLFYAIAFLSIGVLIIKFLNTKKYHLYYSIVLSVTIFIFLVCLLPFAATPNLLKRAEINYSTAFGDYNKTETDFRQAIFRQTPFSLPEYFYGTPSQDYMISENILFYEGSEGIDEGLELYFDVYTPATEGANLPGGNSVLIRIHGGGWTIGDKGAFNCAQMNKYFAAQGYVVFDIQYGLRDIMKLIDFVPVAETRLGNFTIDDMVRHIGIFTSYLADHKEEYSANLNSVFISGGSAGGHLALASGLAITSDKYSNILDPSIKVKGLIPFYPGNGLSVILGIGGKEELVDPIALIEKDSPPCLLYQGSHDGIVDRAIADGFRDAYFEKGNQECAIITMPFGGHGSDFYFSGYYNQVFLYYMERFLYQYR